jgi:hypothetical protein
MSKVIDKVKKLLRLAEDRGATESEAESARRMAKGIMDAAQLTEADLRDDISAVRTVVAGKTQWRPDKLVSLLCPIVSRVLSCWAYIDEQGTVVWVGTDTQREAADELLIWLYTEINELMERSGLKNEMRVRDFQFGIIDVLSRSADRVHDSRRAAARADGPGLVLQDTLRKAIMDATPLDARHERQYSVSVGPDFWAGRAVGGSIQLQRQAGAPDNRSLGSGED